MGDLSVDRDEIEGISSRLDLRGPNALALETIAVVASRHFDVDENLPPLEAVLDVATGVGKTYIMAGAIEYFAAQGHRNFAIIAPGRTILNKTVGNFTEGHPKSLLSMMNVRPTVITADNFATAAMRATMDDIDQVKIFVFTVQALLKPETKIGRKTHKFQEGLGKAFYEHLVALDDLVVFADEHHVYYSPAFSRAVRDLSPRLHLGLTATPHRKTPLEQIVYRYPLAAAIADRLVKTPVIVGRKDDRVDPETKLHDGIRLLQLKEEATARYCAHSGDRPVRPVMLVVAQTIEDAEDYGRILRDPSFLAGELAEAVLVIHSDSPDEALLALEDVEDEASPVRIIISVGMLKEGWDVKNVYVIASMRASVSDILTEQTLGRGLRLPFSAYTGVELLDSLEVLAHERYEELLKKAGVIKEAFIDHRTSAVLRRDSSGHEVAVIETTEVSTEVEISGAGKGSSGGAAIGTVEQRTATAESEVASLRIELAPRSGLKLILPRLVMDKLENPFSLADIGEFGAFRRLGEQIASNPVDELRRTRISAVIKTGADGLRRTELVTSEATDKISSPGTQTSLDDSMNQLLDAVLNAPVVPARKSERNAAGPIVQAFVEGLGSKAEEILSGHLGRAAGLLVQAITQEHRHFVAKPVFTDVVELVTFNPVRLGRPEASRDRLGEFKKGLAYEGWSKGLYDQAWFDSSTERAVANLLDGTDEVEFWVRLHLKDLPILWTNDNSYNPDLVAVEKDATHWVIEVKMDKEVESLDVKAKKAAALRWVNHVNTDDKVEATWRYLFASETAIKTAKGSWSALKKLGV